MTIEITGHTRLCGIFGDPVEHSRSPRLHSTAFKMADADYRYLAFRIEEKDLARAIEAARLFNMRGFNLTMPHKIAVIPFLDRLDPAVDLIGAVNTVVNEDGELVGYNTDGYGFVKTFAVHGHPVAGKKMTQMGIGGAGTAVAAQSALDGAREIAVFSPGNGKSWKRAGEEVALIAEKTGCNITLHDANDYDDLRAEIASSDLLANMTPLGMGALEGKSPIPDACFLHEGLVVQDAIYAPPRDGAPENGQGSRSRSHQRPRNALLPRCALLRAVDRQRNAPVTRRGSRPVRSSRIQYATSVRRRTPSLASVYSHRGYFPPPAIRSHRS